MAMIQLRPVFGYSMVRNAQLNERKIVKYFLHFPRSLSNKNIEIVAKKVDHHLHRMKNVTRWTREQTVTEYIMIHDERTKNKSQKKGWLLGKKFFFWGKPKATGQIEWTGAIVSFVCVDRLATDGLYAIRHGCYILVGPRYLLSDEFSQVDLVLSREEDVERVGAEGENKIRIEERI